MAEENVQSEQSEDQGAIESQQSEDQAQDQGVENSEQSDETTQEGESEDQDTQDAVFLSKDDVPDELKGQWEHMNKAFTNKMQELSQDRRDAKAYRELKDQQLLESKQTPRSEDQKKQLANDLGVDMQNLTPEQKATMDWLNNYVANQVQQYIQPINQQFVQDRTKQELQKVRAKFGDDFTSREPEIAEVIRRNPHLDFEQAYKLLTYDEREKAGLQKAYANIESKKKAKVTRSKSSNAVSESPNLDDIGDIFRSAKRQHGNS